MKIVHMINDYRDICKSAGRADVFEAYRKYAGIYKCFFDGVFRYLYHAPIEALRKYIEKTDFNKLLATAENNYAQGLCDYIASAVERSAGMMKVDFEFELMLGTELANIGGCSIPREDSVPYLYIGIDRPLAKEYIDIFVPHEMYHMIHVQKAARTEPETLLSRAAEEGIASFAPMWIYGMEWNADSVSRLLGVSPAQAGFLMDNTEQIVERAIAQGDAPLTPQIMQEYFCMTDADAETALPGYYVGLYFTHLAVKNGIDFNRFATVPNHEIAGLWLRNYGAWK